MKELDRAIARLAVRVAGCQEGCSDVHSNPVNGIIPRGLVLEVDGRRRREGRDCRRAQPRQGETERAQSCC